MDFDSFPALVCLQANGAWIERARHLDGAALVGQKHFNGSGARERTPVVSAEVIILP